MRQNPALHASILARYASFADEPHACAVHRNAKALLAGLEIETYLVESRAVASGAGRMSSGERKISGGSR